LEELVQNGMCGYGVGVIFRLRPIALAVFSAVCFVCAGPTLAQNKPLRLRNETIHTPPKNAAAQAAQAAVDDARLVSGLFLVQFTAPVQPAWTEDLSGRRVELLRYVPEDAFVARLDRVSLHELRALPFVRWVGEYRTDHKLHAAVRRPPGPRAIVEELPVTVLLSPAATPAELAQARALMNAGAKESGSRFGGVMRGRITAARLSRLAESPAVLWIERAAKFKLVDEISSKIVGGQGTDHPTFTQENGFDGRGVTVAVADSGLHLGDTNAMHLDLVGRVTGFFYYGDLTDWSDEHSHGTHVTGIIAGDGASGEADENGFLYGLGVAPKVNIVVQRLFDGVGEYKAPPTFETMTRDAVQAGAVIGSNSWGDDTQGRYDVSAMEFDALVRDADANTAGDQPYILEFSAGNAGSGPQTIGSPAVAKNVIATGASENDRFEFFIYDSGSETMADFSSRGPCEDGRIKPDVVAPGTWIASLRSPIGDDNNAWAEISDLYLYQGGTSQSGPAVSGAAAVFVQYYRETVRSNTPSPALVKAALINSTADMDDSSGTGPTPNMDEGWGQVDLTQLILSPNTHVFIDQTNALSTGQIYSQSVVVASGTHPLRTTLAYTDVPGFPATIPSLVNDLDLEVIGPDGRIYRGNQFERGESVPDASGFDAINNVEGIYIDEPLPGEYLVRVHARNVVMDARQDLTGINQDFALAISADIPPPFLGLVLLDRTAYTAPSRIQVKVIDADQAGQPSLTAMLRSATEPAGLALTLIRSTFAGSFTGSVATATGVASTDSQLQIADEDWIRAEYFDVSASVNRTAEAVGDLMPPMIVNVATTNELGQTVVMWMTDEASSSIVRFGTNIQTFAYVTNRLFSTEHQVVLGQLVAGRTYFYDVIAIDVAGNSRTNDNGGAHFSFVAQPTPTVLLVDGYMDDEISGEPNIPLNAYTDAIDQTGVSYDVWSVADRGSPVLANLRPYLIVMWRINDSFWVPGNTIPTAQQHAIQQYLDAGGSFFMASMEILSRLDAVPFRTNVLQVGSFDLNPNLLFPCTDCDEDVGVAAIEGPETDSVSIGVAMSLNYANYPVLGDWGPDLGDTFRPTTNAAAFLFDSDSGKPCGLRYPRTGQDSTGRVVFCSVPLDTIPETGDAPNNRGAFLKRAFQFLAPGLDGVGSIAFGQGRYKLPDLVTIEVADSDLAGTASATAYISSTTAPAPLTVELFETVRPGVFRGFVPVVGANEPSAPGQIRAVHGDQIFAEYFDESGGLTVETFANVDSVPPEISALSPEPEYEHAVIRWETSERCDALVQFGESALLGRAAYRDSFDTSHELRLTGLAPDRTYYYRVVIRDLAGNTDVADNNGQPFSFRTRAPVPVPFIDSLDMVNTNWSVFSSEDSQLDWSLGPLNNGFIPYAHSQPNSWASNPSGAPTDTIDTFLISPAIELTGGNIATLKFWQGHDFSERTAFDLWDFGELLLFTNTLTGPVTLATYYDLNDCSETDCWEEQVFDLTPYLGRVIILVWHHQLFSFDLAERPGWALDDVSITVSNQPLGTIQFTNNLAQAVFNLTGPVSRSGRGPGARFAGLPTGGYTASFAPVPHYVTPPSRFQTLAADQTVTITGTYTFPDSNNNGMSDLWETAVFGSVDPARTRVTDSDGDGFTDYAEFVAGTDATQPNSYLRVPQPAPMAGNRLRFDWPSVQGRIYQLQGTRNFDGWLPLSPWLQTNGSSVSFSLPVPGPTQPDKFRIEVLP